MMALWRHLKPTPSQYGVQALRIIGKLSGRNRQFMKDTPQLMVSDLLDIIDALR